jgi:hypothetical protein
MFKSSALKLDDSMLHSVAGPPPGYFPGNAASKAKFDKPISSTANVWVQWLTMAREAQFASNKRRSKSCPSRPFPTASSGQ